MGFDYAKMQATASRLLKQFAQGTVEIRTPVVSQTLTVYDAPSIGGAWAALDAVVRGVTAEYADGTNILRSDLMIVANADAYDPTMGDQIRLDGKIVQVLRIMPIPAIGETVAYRIIVRT